MPRTDRKLYICFIVMTLCAFTVLLVLLGVPAGSATGGLMGGLGVVIAGALVREYRRRNPVG